MNAMRSRIGNAQGFVVRHRSHCAACRNPLGNEWTDILVASEPFNKLASVCCRCAAKAESTQQGYSDVVADVEWWDTQLTDYTHLTNPPPAGEKKKGGAV